MKKSIKFSLLLAIAVLFIVVDGNAQRVIRSGARPYGRNYGMVYRSRPSVSFGFGGIYRGYYPRVYARPRVGFSIGLGFPGVGITMSNMPYGYSRFYFGGYPYYYYNDMYYRRMDDGRYQSVSPPLGATVRKLPAEARERIIDGETYYEVGGTFLIEDIDKTGRRIYRVVGTDGELNTNDIRNRNFDRNDSGYDDDQEYNQPPVRDYPAVKSKSEQTTTAGNYAVGPQLGDRFDVLPKNCRETVIDGVKQYVSPAGTHYKEVSEDGKTTYEVIKVAKD